MPTSCATAGQVRGLYDSMARVTVTPTFVRLNDFQRTVPKGVEELMTVKSAQQD